MELDLKPPPAVKTETQSLSLKEKLTSRWLWLEHLTHAFDQYSEQHGGSLAAGITFSVLMAIFPLIMVAFGVAGIILRGRHYLLVNMEERLRIWLSITTHSTQLNQILDAIVARSSTVGVIGLITMLYGGINFISGLREALTNQWGGQKIQQNFFIRKINDFFILTGMYSLIVLIIAFFIVYEFAQHNIIDKFILHMHLVSEPHYLHALRVLSFVLRYLLIFCMWTYIIAKIPRIQLPFRYAFKAGLLMTALFAILLRLFGYLILNLENNPVLGVAVSIFAIMLFFNWTARFLLFCTAWAATAPENQQFNIVPKIPRGAIITPILSVSDPLVSQTKIFFGGVIIGGMCTIIGIMKSYRPRKRFKPKSS